MFYFPPKGYSYVWPFTVLSYYRKDGGEWQCAYLSSLLIITDHPFCDVLLLFLYIYKQKENSKFKIQKESLLWVAGPVGVCLMGQSHLCSPHPAQHPSPSFSFFFFLNITKKSRTTPLETNATLPTPRSQSPQHLLTRQDTHKCDVYTGIYLQRYMGVL